MVVEQLVSGQQQRNAFLQGEIAKLDVQIKDIASLKADIASLKARQKAVEDLQIDRNVPVHILNELVRQVPEGMYITSIKQDGQNLTVAGVAQTQERVSEFLRNTAYNSEWLVRPELVESKATTAAGRQPRAEAPVRFLGPADREAAARRAGVRAAGDPRVGSARHSGRRVGGRAQEGLRASWQRRAGPQASI